MLKLVYTIVFIAGASIAGKICQYAAVELLGPTLGFELASLVGLAPCLGALIVLSTRYPRFFRFRRVRPQVGPRSAPVARARPEA
jgi:hypothetical protein